MSSPSVTLRVEPAERPLTFAEALNDALCTVMAADESVFILGEDVGSPAGGIYQVTRGLQERFGARRVRNTPIAEQAIIGAAVGAALAGLRPVAELMLLDYATIAMDQLVNHAAKVRYMTGGASQAPLTVRAHVGGPTRGAAQHSQSLEAWFMHTPGLRVVTPGGPRQAKGLLTGCIASDDPCIFLEPLPMLWSSDTEPVPTGYFIEAIDRARVARTGTDVTIVTYGRMLPHCIAAAEQLAREGVASAEVIDLQSLAPIDTATVAASVSKTGLAAVVTQASGFCGPTAELSAWIGENCWDALRAPVLRITAEHVPTPFAEELESLAFPDVGSVLAGVSQLMRRRG